VIAPEHYGRVELSRVIGPGFCAPRIAHKAPETPSAGEKAGRGQTAAHLADRKRRDEWKADFGVLLHQTFERLCDLMDRPGRRQSERLGEVSVGDRRPLLRDILKMRPHPCRYFLGVVSNNGHQRHIDLTGISRMTLPGYRRR